MFSDIIENGKMAMSNALPVEVQWTILQLIPVKDYVKAFAILYLRQGLKCIEFWENFNFEDLDSVTDEFVDLFQTFGDLIQRVVWHYTTWNALTSVNSCYRNFTNVTHIDLSENVQVQSLGFLDSTTNLVELRLVSCINIAEVEFVNFLPYPKYLQSIDIPECNISERSLVSTVPNLTGVKYLNVLDTSLLTIDTVAAIALKLDRFEFCPLLHANRLVDWILKIAMTLVDVTAILQLGPWI